MKLPVLFLLAFVLFQSSLISKGMLNAPLRGLATGGLLQPSLPAVPEAPQSQVLEAYGSLPLAEIVDSTVLAPTYIFGRADFGVGNLPLSVATGDFNGDGRLDLAVVNATDRTVSILLGKSDGTFGPKADFATGNAPVSVATGDFNGDGKLDLAIVNVNDDTVSILLGNGDGTFQPRVDYATGFSPGQVIIVDLNGDGKLDLVTGNGSLSVSILLGNGDGTFKNHVEFATAPGAGAGAGGAVAAGDFNGDGKLDLAVPAPDVDAVSVLLGNGDGTFQTFVSYETGIRPSSVGTGDFNGDGKLDLAVTNTGFIAGTQLNSVSILLGNGDGTFQTHMDQPVGPTPVAVNISDLNRDGRLDLIVTDQNCSGSPCLFGSISVLLGNGDGTFRAHVDYGTGTFPSVAVGDFNGDGPPDVAIAHGNCIFSPCGPASISILLGNGDGTFPGRVEYPTDKDPGPLTTGDFNGDGKLDLVVASPTAGTISLFLGNGDGTFGPRTDISLGNNLSALVAGDFNGDGKVDLVVSNIFTNTVSILLGKGDGTFQTRVNFATGSGPTSVITGDFNRDGKLDLAVVNAGFGFGNTVSILLGNGDGTFKAHVDFAAGMTATGIAAGDFNNDGKLDLAVTNNNGDGTISILLGNGDGTFQSPIAFPTGFFSQSVATGDFNGDGKLDLAVADSTSSTTKTIAVLLGNGDGTFQTHVDYDAGNGARFVTTGDFDGDGDLDLAVVNASFGFDSVSILRGNGDGTFQPRLDYPIGTQPFFLTTGDFNTDGGLDLAVTVGPADRAVSVLLSTPVIALFPTKLTFANQLVGTRSPVQTILLSNPGSTPLKISGIAGSGDFTQSNTCSGTVAVGANCTVSITFAPTAGGTRTGRLTITDNSPSSPQVIGLTGTGLATLPFASFTVRGEIELGPPGAFDVQGNFILGAGSNGIKPLTEDVKLQVGTFSTTIPAGSFREGWRGFEFEGFINGVKLEVVIHHVRGNRFLFTAKGEGANLTGTVNPVTVGLTIGDDGGSKAVTADFD
jgi:hypothetical protein